MLKREISELIFALWLFFGIAASSIVVLAALEDWKMVVEVVVMAVVAVLTKVEVKVHVG